METWARAGFKSITHGREINWLEANNYINLKLDSSQALVLFEFLSDKMTQFEELFEDESERFVLIKILGYLESNLNEPLSSDYLTKLKTARELVRKNFWKVMFNWICVSQKLYN